MLIRNATLQNGARADLRCTDGTISAIAPQLRPHPGETIIDADGGAVLPGLHDHHIHLLALAASLNSFDCASAATPAALAAALRAASRPGQWLRAINYHEGIAGPIDRNFLDAAVPHAPVRVQHRSGRLWIFNSAAMSALAGSDHASPLESAAGQPTGRLYDQDSWLRARLPSTPPDLRLVGTLLAAHGVTAVTDATPANDMAFVNLIHAAQQCRDLPQRVAVMGTLAIVAAPRTENLFPLALKIHLHDGDYPAPEAFIADAKAAHARGLGIAVHCVTEADLAYTLSLLEESGLSHTARIEHASVVSPAAIAWLAQSGATVVTQPHFIAERGHAYVRDIPAAEHDHLYRCASLQQAGIKLGGGTDAPFGGHNPWRSMHAAVLRRTPQGVMLGAAERLSPEAALALFTTSLTDPGGPPRVVTPGAPADLCVLTQPWSTARCNLADITVRATLCGGTLIHHNQEQNPAGRKVA